jgi:transcription elongation factor
LSKPSTINQIRDDSDDDEKVEDVLRQAKLAGGSSIYAKGDKINVLKGDLTGLKGTVVAISESGLVTFKPIGIPQLTKPLDIDAANVCKYFEPGDLVRIIEAKYKGETGQVLDVEGPRISVVLD